MNVIRIGLDSIARVNSAILVSAIERVIAFFFSAVQVYVGRTLAEVNTLKVVLITMVVTLISSL